MSTETYENRIKRMRMRSWRRGMKEMDIVMGGYADARLDSMTRAQLDAWDALLDENDQDLLAWITGQQETPAPLLDLISDVAAFARQG
jgi:antitoxin CptB